MQTVVHARKATMSSVVPKLFRTISLDHDRKSKRSRHELFSRSPILVNGNYTAWSRWSVCDKRCGSGVQTRWRACANPVPQNGGLPCTYMGPDTETKLCLNKPCRSKYYLFNEMLKAGDLQKKSRFSSR